MEVKRFSIAGIERTKNRIEINKNLNTILLKILKANSQSQKETHLKTSFVAMLT